MYYSPGSNPTSFIVNFPNIASSIACPSGLELAGFCPVSDLPSLAAIGVSINLAL